jgi:hypothetical protein
MADLVAANDAAWDTRLDGVPRDVYHTSGYHRYASTSGAAEPLLVVVGHGTRGLAWPYLLRRVAAVEGLEHSGATDIDSVYGYPGPIAWGCDPGDPFLAAAWGEVCEVWRSQGAVAAFTRFHPLLGNVELARGFADASGGGDGQPSASGTGPIVAGGQTVSIDCALDDADALAGYARVLRQEIAQGRRAGLVTEPDEDWSEIDAFISMYEATMSRNRAASSYGLSLDDALRLREELGDHIHLLVTRLDGAVVGAGLFTEFDRIVQAHLVGTDESQHRLSPLKVMLDDARMWARRRGNRILHLGGGRGGREDSLLAFKGRFSPRRHAFHTGRWILDPAGYAELADRRSIAAAERGLAVGDPGWFPAYRAPLVGSDVDRGVPSTPA